MITEAKCKICNEVFRANSEANFTSAIINHYSTQHKKEWLRLKQLENEASKELHKLEEKYKPEIDLLCGTFRLNIYRLIK